MEKKVDEYLKDPTSKYIAILELRIGQILKEYYTTLGKKDFDKLVDLTIKFAKLDAERIKFRCELRARKIAELINQGLLSGKIVIHTYHLHDILVKYIEDKVKDYEIQVVNLHKLVLEKLGIQMPTHPGRELTLCYVYGRRLSNEEEKLLAARSVMYVRMLPRFELRPSPQNEYPHTWKDYEILTFVNKLSYDECRNEYLRSFTT